VGSVLQCTNCGGKHGAADERCPFCGIEIQRVPVSAPSAPQQQWAPPQAMAPPQPQWTPQPQFAAASGGNAARNLLVVIIVVMGAVILLSVLAPLILIFVFASEGSSSSASGTPAPPISVGVPLSGTIGPSVVTVNGEPRIDHPLTITTTGEYQIDLVSADTNHYDPVVVLLRDGVELARNDDGPNGLNSQLVMHLAPGAYVVRVSAFGGVSPSNMTYNVTVRRRGFGGAVPPAEGRAGSVGVPPAVGGGDASGCDALEACCNATRSEAQTRSACVQVNTYRNLPSGSGESACRTALQGLRSILRATGGFVPPQCQ
jgi:hypothetical protein